MVYCIPDGFRIPLVFKGGSIDGAVVTALLYLGFDRPLQYVARSHSGLGVE